MHIRKQPSQDHAHRPLYTTVVHRSGKPVRSRPTGQQLQIVDILSVFKDAQILFSAPSPPPYQPLELSRGNVPIFPHMLGMRCPLLVHSFEKLIRGFGGGMKGCRRHSVVALPRMVIATKAKRVRPQHLHVCRERHLACVCTMELVRACQLPYVCLLQLCVCVCLGFCGFRLLRIRRT